MDEAVRRWRQKGNVYFWFENDKGQGFGWQLAADELGCASLNEITELALTAKFPSRFNIAISKGRGSNPRAVATLAISHNRVWPDTCWRLRENKEGVALELGAQRLIEFQQMLPKLQKGWFNDITFPPDAADDAIWI
jgi:hypothetical protein